MKSRELAKELGTTRPVHINNNKICVSSGLVSDILSLDLETMRISYALDTWREGRKALRNKDELGLVWDNLQRLVDENKIQYYLDGDDKIENPIPVFTFTDKDKLIETQVEKGKLCYPNVTANGLYIYDNTFFPTKKEAIDDKISSYTYYIENDKDRIKERERDLEKAHEILKRDSIILQKLKKLL